MPFITPVTSSAPSLPFCASFSDIVVKPEMSTNASVPSSSRRRASGETRSQSTTTRGTYGVRSTDVVSETAVTRSLSMPLDCLEGIVAG